VGLALDKKPKKITTAVWDGLTGKIRGSLTRTWGQKNTPTKKPRVITTVLLKMRKRQGNNQRRGCNQEFLLGEEPEKGKGEKSTQLHRARSRGEIEPNEEPSPSRWFNSTKRGLRGKKGLITTFFAWGPDRRGKGETETGEMRPITERGPRQKFG